MIRVVVADDHAVVRRGLTGLIESTDDLEVVGVARDGREAVDLVREHRPDVAVIFPVHLNPNVNGPVMARLGTALALRERLFETLDNDEPEVTGGYRLAEVVTFDPGPALPSTTTVACLFMPAQ